MYVLPPAADGAYPDDGACFTLAHVGQEGAVDVQGRKYVRAARENAVSTLSSCMRLRADLNWLKVSSGLNRSRQSSFLCTQIQQNIHVISSRVPASIYPITAIACQHLP